jgi:uncharacterized membrane protein YedE/YeeE
MKEHLTYGAFGLFMGVILSSTGFTSFDEVHKMFTLQDFRLILVFAGAVGLLVIGFAMVGRCRSIPKKKFNRGTIPGSVLFGMGWAITGSCPSIALVQLGEGQLAALFVVFGIFFGVWVYRRMAAGSIKLDSGICGE